MSELHQAPGVGILGAPFRKSNLMDMWSLALVSSKCQALATRALTHHWWSIDPNETMPIIRTFDVRLRFLVLARKSLPSDLLWSTRSPIRHANCWEFLDSEFVCRDFVWSRTEGKGTGTQIFILVQVLVWDNTLRPVHWWQFPSMSPPRGASFIV
jgi:hypothetical protein